VFQNLELKVEIMLLAIGCRSR